MDYLDYQKRHGKLVIGTESCMDTIYKNKVKIIILAEDSADRTIKNFQIKCREKGIPFYLFGTKAELSKRIGANNKTVIGVKDKNLAQAIEKILNGGDVIG